MKQFHLLSRTLSSSSSATSTTANPTTVAASSELRARLVTKSTPIKINPLKHYRLGRELQVTLPSLGLSAVNNEARFLGKLRGAEVRVEALPVVSRSAEEETLINAAWNGIVMRHNNDSHPNVLKVLGISLFRDPTHEVVEEKQRAPGETDPSATLTAMEAAETRARGLGLLIVSEPTERGNLLEFIQARRKGTSSTSASSSSSPQTQGNSISVIKLLAQVADALAFMHERGYVHGNVQARNVFVSENLEARLGGFESCFFLDHFHLRKQPASTLYAGRYFSESLLAPELVTAQPFGHKIDVYAYGKLVVEVLQVLRRTGGTSSSESSAREETEDDVSFLAILASQCLSPQQYSRPSMREVLSSFRYRQSALENDSAEEEASTREMMEYECKYGDAQVGAYVLQGERPTMEDYVTVIQDEGGEFEEPGDGAIIACVFDGHGGGQVAEMSSRIVPLCLLESVLYGASHGVPEEEEEKSEGRFANAFTKGFTNEDVQRAFWAADSRARRLGMTSGSTATVAVITKREVVSAWVGDSSGVRYQLKLEGEGGAKKIISVSPLVFPHVPSRDDEKERVLKAGGYLGTDKEARERARAEILQVLEKRRRMKMKRRRALLGSSSDPLETDEDDDGEEELVPSNSNRFELKEEEEVAAAGGDDDEVEKQALMLLERLSEEGAADDFDDPGPLRVYLNDAMHQGGVAMTRSLGNHSIKHLISSQVEVLRLPRRRIETSVAEMTEKMKLDMFLVIGSDGLFDAVSYWDLFELADGYQFFAKNDAWKPEEIASNLATSALALGTYDNVSVIVVKLNSTSEEKKNTTAPPDSKSKQGKAEEERK